MLDFLQSGEPRSGTVYPTSIALLFAREHDCGESSLPVSQDPSFFESYPGRRGWDQQAIFNGSWTESLASGELKTKSDEEVLERILSLLQSWLLFGFLEALLGKKVCVDDYAEEREQPPHVFEGFPFRDDVEPIQTEVLKRFLSIGCRRKPAENGQEVMLCLNPSRVKADIVKLASELSEKGSNLSRATTDGGVSTDAACEGIGQRCLAAWKGLALAALRLQKFHKQASVLAPGVPAGGMIFHTSGALHLRREDKRAEGSSDVPLSQRMKPEISTLLVMPLLLGQYSYNVLRPLLRPPSPDRMEWPHPILFENWQFRRMCINGGWCPFTLERIIRTCGYPAFLWAWMNRLKPSQGRKQSKELHDRPDEDTQSEVDAHLSMPRPIPQHESPPSMPSLWLNKARTSHRSPCESIRNDRL